MPALSEIFDKRKRRESMPRGRNRVPSPWISFRPAAYYRGILWNPRGQVRTHVLYRIGGGRNGFL